MKNKEIKRKFDEIVSFAEVEKFLDTPVKRYSSGMYVRLAFAIAAHLEPEILVVDEVLAVGDAEFQKKSLGKMEDVGKEGRTVIFVSHNMGAISQLCNRVILLSSGKVKFDGNTEESIELYSQSDISTKKTFDNAILKYVEIYQKNEKLHIFAEYNSPIPLAIPNLGFVVSNPFGAPIFGINPKIQNVKDIPRNTCTGSIHATIVNPKLLDGNYALSIWLGDGITELFHEENVLHFNVSGMVKQHQLPSSSVGFIYPECEWTFISNNYHD